MFFLNKKYKGWMLGFEITFKTNNKSTTVYKYFRDTKYYSIKIIKSNFILYFFLKRLKKAI